MKLGHSLVKKIKQLCSKDELILSAYIFGSSVTGRENRMSDVDIALYLKNSVARDRFLDIRLKYLETFGSLFSPHKLDLVILNESTDSFNYSVIKNGIVLYEKDRSSRINFDSSVISKCLDFLPFHSVQLSYLKRQLRK